MKAKFRLNAVEDGWEVVADRTENAGLMYLATPAEGCGEVLMSTRPRRLRLALLRPRDFERLCHRLTREQGTVEDVRIFGVDLYACWHDGMALPKYAPEINPTEGIWSLIKRGPLANLVPVGLDGLAGTVRFALKRIQYRPELVDGCVAETGLIIRAS